MNIERLLIIFLLYFSLAASAQPPAGKAAVPSNKAILKGKVIDGESKQLMEYANVSIYTQDSSLVTGGITDSNGEFKIGPIKFGTYYVEANFIGFTKTRINNIQLNENNRQIDLGTIELEPAHQKLDEVSVIADKSRVEYKIDKKIVNVSQDLNANGGTAADVLENTPSVQVDIEGNVTVRGSSNFTVYIDGRPSTLSGSDALQQIPASALENIEIITNPSAKYDPDGTAGIINLVMKKDILSGFNGIVNASIGTRNKQRFDMTINQKTKKHNLTFGVDYSDFHFHGKNQSTRETFKNDTVFHIDKMGNRGFNRKGYGFKGGVDFYLSDLTTLGFNAHVGHYDFESGGVANVHKYTTPATTETFSVETDPSPRNRNYASGTVNFQHKFNEDGSHQLMATLYYSHRNSDDIDVENEQLADANYEPTNLYLLRIRTTSDELSDRYRFKADYTRPLGDFGKLEAGVQSRLRRENEDYLFEAFNAEKQQWINNPDFSSSMIFKRDIHAAYTTLSSKWGALGYMAGLRGEYTNRETDHTSNTEPYILHRFDLFPTTHLSYTLFDKSQVMASYSRRIDRPRGRDLDPFENYRDQYSVSVGNPALKPEYTNSYELSYMKRFGKSFISLEGFYKATNNVITRFNTLRDDGVIVQKRINLNHDYSKGGELMANINLKEWLLLNGSVSIYNYKIADQSSGEYVERTSTNTDGRLNATFKFSSNSRMEIVGRYRGPTVSIQGKRESMFYSNISYRQDLMKKKLTATLSMRDLFGTANWRGTSSGPNFNSTYKWQREPRILTLTLSYKINNYKMDKSNQSDTNEVEFDNGGGGGGF
ncbi:MAG TPA: TonB-dependent receptor [Sunxiuqinia sp.]|nr:TonB-dependent receptor [Sunxiuqinia sp.]